MTFKIGNIEVLHKQTPALGRDGDHYQGFEPGLTVLKTGHRKADGLRAFSTETIFERDVEVPLRDGTVLRADVFRPNNDQTVPALISWSPYGKGGSGMLNLSFMPGHAGLPSDALSGYEKFEAPDPAEWVPRGYAVVNIDARGVFDSAGNIRFLGSEEGKDGHDAIEYIAQLPWCTGSTALVGNSWLAMAAYHIAVQQPSHLKCFAPLEGASDLHRETHCRGGIPQPAFAAAIAHAFSGRTQTEDLAAMLDKYPDWNEYWQDKRIDFAKIKVPAYVLASYSTGLHTEGSFRCYEELDTARWLTIHDTQEWHDLYQPKRIEDLNKFFDHYLKGIDNGWQSTPRVRASLLGYNQPNIADHEVPDWPLPNTQYTKLYLSAQGQLNSAPSTTTATASYQSDIAAQQKDADDGELLFSHTFTKRTYLLGYSKAQLHISAQSHHDADVFVQLRKADKGGKVLRSHNIPLADLKIPEAQIPPLNILQYLGPDGMLRASRRDIDQSISKPHYPVPSLRAGSEQYLTPGEVVKLEIGIWPSGMIFEAGEQLVLKISGHPMRLAEFPQLWGSYESSNKGEHIVHFGGEYESFVQVPLVEL